MKRPTIKAPVVTRSASWVGWARYQGQWRQKLDADSKRECEQKLTRIPDKDSDGVTIEKAALRKGKRPA